ncbi:sensor domain-containing diguanylate cyclase [Lacticaseibacillus parakribbianus]|uniref:GGDEF domain-containing protein n=1 Tax=Lacticaseibacillus parakribbianus TaxID=2970927 RepID=UPI0021CB7FEA|nr:GGDEF domain-containing protein [Lacticaseibacillus parakribbianus]
MSQFNFLLSDVLALGTALLVVLGGLAFATWVRASTAAPWVVAHREALLGAGAVVGTLYLGGLLLNAATRWTALNLLIVALALLSLRPLGRPRAWLGGTMLAAYALVALGHRATWLAVAGLLVAVAALAGRFAAAAARQRHGLVEFGLLIALAAGLLVAQAQWVAPAPGPAFWGRELLGLALLAGLGHGAAALLAGTLARTNRLVVQTRVDELTGVQNFGTFTKELGRLFAEFQKNGTGYSVFEGDLDHFKQINDTYGHLGGNAVLRRLARELAGFADGLPFSATAYRLGGEEFAIIARTDLSQAAAQAIGDRFLELLQLVQFNDVAEGLTITCSIGQARVQDADYSAEDVYKQADRNLYAAKHSGRNRIVPQADGTGGQGS